MLEIDKQLSRVKNDLCPVCESPNISADNDFTSSEVIEIIVNLLVSAGYSKENIIEIMNQYEI